VLEKIIFRCGSSAGQPSLEIAPGPLTVLVGPNNSGKSLALREIRLSMAEPQVPRHLVEAVHVPNFKTPEELEAFVAPFAVTDGKRTHFSPVPGGSDAVVLGEEMKTHYGSVEWVASIFGRALLLRLDGSTRLSLVRNQAIEDLLKPATNHLEALWKDDGARKKLREITVDAFGLHFVLDPTLGKSLRIRMSGAAPRDEEEEQSLSARARSFHAAATPIADMSDGVKAFTGILAAAFCGTFRAILVDEPEAFLHPPLARRLGLQLAKAAAERQGNVIAATHSAHFVMGCIESGAQVQIVRLTYLDRKASARLLDSTSLRTLMRDPLLRSANVLSAVFHTGAVVTEADADRAFYQEIALRLIDSKRFAAPDSVFLHAQNKQTVRRIVQPLRMLGVPAAAIVDIDILKGGGNEWTELLEAAGVPDAQHQSLHVQRHTLMTCFGPNKDEMKRSGGLKLLSDDAQEAAKNLLKLLADYGVFVVPHGELESWLPTLGATGHGPPWLIDTFEKMGDDPTTSHYLKPSRGDVWDFVESIGRWLSDPGRKGMPN